MAKYAMAIDLKACIGCHTCSVACKTANNLPKDMWWLNVKTDGADVMDNSTGVFPNALLSYTPVNCMHCDNAPCVAACPTGATLKREDGIVTMDPDKCVGCGACVAACPYEGVRTLNTEEPGYDAEFALGAADAPKHKANTVEKCTFCVNRVDKGEKPYCIDACPARCRVFGDIDDPESEISKLLKERQYKRLAEDKGTCPNIFYLI